MLLAIGVGLGPFAANSVIITFVPAHAVAGRFSRTTTLDALMIASALSPLTLVAYAALSDVAGLKPVYFSGGGGPAVTQDLFVLAKNTRMPVARDRCG